MYHISDDKRAQKSAELIWRGMEQCLQEKPFCGGYAATPCLLPQKEGDHSRSEWWRIYFPL